MREKNQNTGIRQKICRVRERRMLGSAAPMAWKNTGKIRESTAGRKLRPMMWKAWVPMAKTSGSEVNSPRSCAGISSKQAIPTSMNIMASTMESFTTRWQRE